MSIFPVYAVLNRRDGYSMKYELPLSKDVDVLIQEAIRNIINEHVYVTLPELPALRASYVKDEEELTPTEPSIKKRRFRFVGGVELNLELTYKED